MDTRWRKMLGDVRAARGRFLMMALALVASLSVVTAIFMAYAVLGRELPRNYLSTHAASAQLEMDRVDAAAVELAERFPGIADAEAGATLSGRVAVGDNDWMPLLLFVVPDFSRLHLNSVRSETGAWPPPTDTMLVERSALPLTHRSLGGQLPVQTAQGGLRTLRIAGTVHDPGLAPAWQEQTIYGYITPATLAELGESPDLHLLKVAVAEQADDARAIAATAGRLVDRLQAAGYRVEQVRIPPPRRHPHQGQLNAVLRMLQVFSLLALGLGAVLCATSIRGLLAQQTRQIAIMKAIGARTGQIAALYLGLVAALGAVSAAIGLPLGLWAGRGFIDVVAQLLNLEIASHAVPLWLLVVVISLGIAAPVLAALIPIRSAARRTVREALDDHGVARRGGGFERLDRVLARIRFTDPALTLALRNLFRQRARLLMTLGLLAVAGAMFIASLNLKLAWESYVAQAQAYRHYDTELFLSAPAPRAQVMSVLADVPGVRHAEAWSVAPAAVDNGTGLEVVRTYPDGGHGGFTLRAAPARTHLVDVDVREGRWLRPDDQDAVVLNNLARDLNFPAVRVGQRIALRVADRPASFRVVGIVRERLTPGAAYTTPAAFASATGRGDRINALRIVASDPTATDALGRVVVAAMAEKSIGVTSILSEKHYGAAQAGHIYILVFALGFIATMMTVVGTLGLASALSTGVIERTREYGVVRAVGARASDVLKSVLGEGLLVALISWVIALPLAAPISLGVGTVLASISNQPLSLQLSLRAAALWLGVVLIASALASYVPARRASQLTVRQTLSFT